MSNNEGDQLVAVRSPMNRVILQIPARFYLAGFFLAFAGLSFWAGGWLWQEAAGDWPLERIAYHCGGRTTECYPEIGFMWFGLWCWIFGVFWIVCAISCSRANIWVSSIGWLAKEQARMRDAQVGTPALSYTPLKSEEDIRRFFAQRDDIQDKAK